MLLGPGHQPVPCEAAVGPQDDPHLRPACPDLAHQPRHRLDRAGAGVDVRPPQLGDQQVIATEDVERQVAVAAIIAVEEAALLAAVQRVVGGVQVEHDLRGRHLVRIEEQLDEQPLDQARVVADLVVARRRPARRMLEPVERRLAGERRAIGATGGELAHGRGQHRVVAQGIVVEQVLVAQGQREHPLTDQGRQIVLDLLGRTLIRKARREPPDQADRPVGGAQEQRPGIRGDGPTVKPSQHGTAFDARKLEPIRATVCRHWGDPPRRLKVLQHNNFRRFGTPMHLLPVRYPG